MYTAGAGPGRHFFHRPIIFWRSVHVPGDGVGSTVFASRFRHGSPTRRIFRRSAPILGPRCQFFLLPRHAPSFLSSSRSSHLRPDSPPIIRPPKIRFSIQIPTISMDCSSSFTRRLGCASRCVQPLEEPVFRCFCGDPAFSVTSGTLRNPGRKFYICHKAGIGRVSSARHESPWLTGYFTVNLFP